MQSVWVVFFAVAAGFTASGIVANCYRLLGVGTTSRGGRTLRNIVLLVAGPTVLFESALRGLKNKQWTPFAFWVAVGVLTYWSFFLGLLILDLATAA